MWLTDSEQKNLCFLTGDEQMLALVTERILSSARAWNRNKNYGRGARRMGRNGIEKGKTCY